jgi:hypothetical protein
MKMSSDWISLDCPVLPTSMWGLGPRPIHLRPDGYPSRLLPNQCLTKLMLRDVQFHAPAGRYVCLYDGDGVLIFGFDATVLTIGKGCIEFDFKPSTVRDNGIFMQIVATNPANPIHNIRVIMPGFEHTYEAFPFHPHYLKNLEHYSALRFMGWGNINANTEVEWSNRTLPTNATLTNIPVEYMVALANQLGANPWFNIPHMASDSYVKNFISLVHKNLRPDLKVNILVYNALMFN